MTTTIPWGDGSGENITLTYSGTTGIQEVVITSPEYTEDGTRYKDVVFSITAGQTTISRTLRITQLGTEVTMVVVMDNDVVTIDSNETVTGDTL